jgi:ABC-type transport system involved in cytochrome c biogenesis permease subunit
MALLLVLIRRLRLRAAAAGQPAGQRLVWLRQQRQLQLLSRIFLLPAITTLGIGIFTGAVWAHVSWGNYWSWDPKETWALITLMIYAAAIHQQSIPRLRRPLFFHIYMVLAFLSLIITYFGVNYFLGGMHSYA